MPRVFALFLLALLALLPACASAPEDENAGVKMVPAGMYERAFRAARDTLREERFTIERVDTAGGVITTRPDPAATSVDDVINRQRRIVRVSFHQPVPPGGTPRANEEGPTGPGPGSTDGPLEMRVRVIVERVERPLWRVSPTSVRLGSIAADPSLSERGMTPWYPVAIGADADMADELAAKIAERWSMMGPTPSEPAQPAATPTPAARQTTAPAPEASGPPGSSAGAF